MQTFVPRAGWVYHRFLMLPLREQPRLRCRSVQEGNTGALQTSATHDCVPKWELGSSLNQRYTKATIARLGQERRGFRSPCKTQGCYLITVVQAWIDFQ